MKIFCTIPVLVFTMLFKAEINSQTITDYDGNTYNTITIGNQVWMAENLKSIHYSDGTAITGVWSYNNLDSLSNIYGKLYSWESAMRGASSNNSVPSGIQGVCPVGWHLPSSAEWDILINKYGGQFGGAGGKLKEAGTAHWNAPNTGATNESGFTALPGGNHNQPDGGFGVLGATGLWWTTYKDGGYVYMVAMGSESENAIQFGSYIAPGYNYEDVSVRCLKNGGSTSFPDEEYENYFDIYPNPAKNWLVVSLNKTIESDLIIYSVVGKELLHLKLNQKINHVDLNSLPSGIYIVSVKCQGNSAQKILIKSNN
ncbi:MAG: FISUMP domain-containing protein [Bacteroidales bacterium]